MRVFFRVMLALGGFCVISGYCNAAFAYVKGIYVSQGTAENSAKMTTLIQQAKAAGVNTFVVDAAHRNTQYASNMEKLRASGIRYVARVVMFPGGGNHAQVTDPSIWAGRLALAKYAVSVGAQEIQLDYIRYSSKTGSSPLKAQYVHNVIKYFKKNLPSDVKLQIDIFGVAAHKPSNTIGQNVPMFASSLDAICPMVYPSHYEPYRYHATRPYNTVLNSVDALQTQLKNNANVKIYAYIESYNYRYPMSMSERMSYTRAQIQAAKDGGAQGFFVWSAKNQYDVLFSVLRQDASRT